MERWLHVGAGQYRGNDGRVLSESELMAHWMARCRRRTRRNPRYVVQRRVFNHPDIEDLGNGVLTTIRVLTCRNEAGGFECTHAGFRMPARNDAIVDNFHAGGIAARVDLASGELGRAIELGYSPGHGWCTSHPVTGAKILGRRIPQWKEVLDLALQAHAAFDDRILIGWDLALTPGGPVLLEAQGRPDLDFVQRTHEQPFGASRGGELLAYHVQRALEIGGGRGR